MKTQMAKTESKKRITLRTVWTNDNHSDPIVTYDRNEVKPEDVKNLFPQIEITIPDQNDDPEWDDPNAYLYLSPFRGYSFQVSGGPNGNWSIEDTTVFGLGNLMGMTLNTEDNTYPEWSRRSNIEVSDRRMIGLIMQQFVENLLLKVCIRYDGYLPRFDENQEGLRNSEVVSQFIDATMAWLNAYRN